MAADDSRRQLLITLDDDVLDAPDAVVARLKRAGLTDVTLMAAIGVVSGEAPASKVPALRSVKGVRAVEESARIQLPPPDAPIQ
jgi:hypothetical protein